jgi:hypothetical protein
MDDMKVCEAPQSLWDRVAAAMALTPDQVRATVDRWGGFRGLRLGRCAVAAVF